MSISQSKSVQFAGRTLLVSAVGNSLRVNLRIAEAQAQEIAKERQITPLEEHYYYGVYPVLSVCTTAEDGSPIPTADEMLDNQDVEETNNWYLAAREQNPQLFPDSKEPEAETEEVKEEVKKKRTRNRRTIHTPE